MNKYILLIGLLSFSLNAEIISFEETEVCKPETDACISSINITTSKNQVVVENLFGEFHLSKKNNQIFGCGGNALSQGEFATITHEDGKTIEIKHQGFIQYCGVTSNEEYYWIAYEHIVENQIAAKIIIISSSGGIIHSKIGSFDASNTITFNGNSETIVLGSSF